MGIQRFPAWERRRRVVLLAHAALWPVLLAVMGGLGFLLVLPFLGGAIIAFGVALTRTVESPRGQERVQEVASLALCLAFIPGLAIMAYLSVFGSPWPLPPGVEPVAAVGFFLAFASVAGCGLGAMVVVRRRGSTRDARAVRWLRWPFAGGIGWTFLCWLLDVALRAPDQTVDFRAVAAAGGALATLCAASLFVLAVSRIWAPRQSLRTWESPAPPVVDAAPTFRAFR